MTLLQIPVYDCSATQQYTSIKPFWKDEIAVGLMHDNYWKHNCSTARATFFPLRTRNVRNLGINARRNFCRVLRQEV
jgi:hypothetical protein